MREFTPKPFILLPIDKLKIKWLRHSQQKLAMTDWERGFLKDIKRKMKLSLLQKKKIEEIYEQYRHRKNGRRGVRPYRPIFEDIGSYDYIHDFDK